MKPEYHDWYMKLGKRMAIVRISKNLSQKELADKINVDMYLISKYERAANGISLDRLMDIAVALEVPLQVLFDFTELESLEGKK